MKFILGKKLDMTQIWQDDNVVAVTKVKAGPCAVVQVKNNEKDNYEAVQIGFETKKDKNTKKPQKGHMQGLGNFRYLKEFRTKDANLKKGDQINIETFTVGDKIQVTGISKGKGFQGVVKRHGFKGSKKTHGNKDQLRMPGSIGATGPAHVFKGTRMPGHMGSDRITVKNLEIVGIDKDNNFLFIKGAIPGSKDSLILISGQGEIKIAEKPDKGEHDIQPGEKPAAEKENKVKASEDNNENAAAAEKAEDEKNPGTPEPSAVKAAKGKEAETPEEVEQEVVEAKEKVDEKKKQQSKGQDEK